MVFGKTIPGRVNWLFIFQKEKKYYSDRAAAAAFNSLACPRATDGTGGRNCSAARTPRRWQRLAERAWAWPRRIADD
jgi:hypothetical protein